MKNNARKCLDLDLNSQGLCLRESGQGPFLIKLPSTWPMLPEIDGAKTSWTLINVEGDNSSRCLLLKSKGQGPVDELRIHVESSEGVIDLSCEFKVSKDCYLNALHLFPEGAGLNVYDVVNFRNRHFTSATWPELLVGKEVKTETYSNDWQFAPHPTAMILRKNELSLFAGFLDLQASFGMRMEIRQSVVKRWDLNFGAADKGLQLRGGETFKSGRLRLFLREGLNPYEMFEEFGCMLVEKKSIADPAFKKSFAWWNEPIYCTWGDQWMLGNKAPAVSLADQTAESAVSATDSLTEDFLWRAVETIQREKLPIRTIILDEGWAIARGDWRPHPSHLPDFRKVVDRLHGEGFKVLVWWNWAEIAKEAEVDPRYLVDGGKWLNKHGARWRDYSDPEVQHGYLKPLFHQFFSSEAGCYDLDGVKTDFLADKVHPETPFFNPEWRGEERYFRKVTELFYKEMRSHKEDALHLGCAGNYWLAEFMDLNRTYDVHSSNWLEHEERAQMLACTSPGVTVSYDMMTCTENTERWFASARKLKAGVEIGNVLYERPDIFTAVRPATGAYLKMLKEYLG